ncbi:hypothetical protein PQE70_gp058 [Bacillus phage vB_BanS_Nate]|uniref:Uncharacterized protein n=1 Tax=Bacillus phage vB_BanS_Nate TaxID=2894788 RepID=A0AAE9CEB0_9CAUD|nr:hypothetical protein PQE70_gp058 [Bacillus phage vB_BanS_Nate]UGO50911.1 hypothetical protein NATE_58 [Bacillus phage vB_BanS_Nate]
MNKPTWKKVLFSGNKFHGNIVSFYFKVVEPSGYPYFEWNGIIYKVITDENIKDRNIKYYQTDYFEDDIK